MNLLIALKSQQQKSLHPQIEAPKKNQQICLSAENLICLKFLLSLSKQSLISVTFKLDFPSFVGNDGYRILSFNLPKYPKYVYANLFSSIAIFDTFRSLQSQCVYECMNECMLLAVQLLGLNGIASAENIKKTRTKQNRILYLCVMTCVTTLGYFNSLRLQFLLSFLFRCNLIYIFSPQHLKLQTKECLLLGANWSISFRDKSRKK